MAASPYSAPPLNSITPFLAIDVSPLALAVLVPPFLHQRALSSANNKKRALKRGEPTYPRKSNTEKDSAVPGRSMYEKFSLYADGTTGRGDMGGPQSTGFKSFGMHRKDNKGYQLD